MFSCPMCRFCLEFRVCGHPIMPLPVLSLDLPKPITVNEIPKSCLDCYLEYRDETLRRRWGRLCAEQFTYGSDISKLLDHWKAEEFYSYAYERKGPPYNKRNELDDMELSEAEAQDLSEDDEEDMDLGDLFSDEETEEEYFDNHDVMESYTSDQRPERISANNNQVVGAGSAVDDDIINELGMWPRGCDLLIGDFYNL